MVAVEATGSSTSELATISVGLLNDSLRKIAPNAVIKSKLLIVERKSLLLVERLKNDSKLNSPFACFYKKSLHHWNSRNLHIITQCIFECWETVIGLRRKSCQSGRPSVPGTTGNRPKSPAWVDKRNLSSHRQILTQVWLRLRVRKYCIFTLI